MPRPKKPPRVRLQIVVERDQARRLRAFCKERDFDISYVVRRAIETELLSALAGEWQVRNGFDT